MPRQNGALTQHAISTIGNASRDKVVDALTKMLSATPKHWLHSSHPAKSGINKNHKPGASNAVTPIALAEYLALSAPTHCTDGWAFLSRALHAVLIGDSHSAWHYAYYAELRATLSLLAASGVGVFNLWNGCLNQNGEIEVIDDKNEKVLGTHEMAWRAIRCLMENTSTTTDQLATSISVDGNDFLELVKAAFPGSTTSKTVYTNLKHLTLDLASGRDDRNFRNRCSYLPHELTKHALSVESGAEFIYEFWSLFEPQPSAAFIGLDRFMLRHAFGEYANELVDMKKQKTAGSNTQAFELDAAYTRMENQYPSLTGISRDFILRKTEPKDPLLLIQAKDKNPRPSSPLPIIARAAISLRLATGVSRSLLKDSGLTSVNGLGFWLSPYAFERGFCSDGHGLNDWMDLFADPRDAASNISEMMVINSSALSRSTFLDQVGSNLQRATEVERIPFWGLAA
jgi:hypothetical protein